MQYVNSEIYSSDILERRESRHNENKLHTHGLDMSGGAIVASEEYKTRSLPSYRKYFIPHITHHIYGGLGNPSTRTSQNIHNSLEPSVKLRTLKNTSRVGIDVLSLSTRNKYKRAFIDPVITPLLTLYKNFSAIFLRLTLKLITRITFASKKARIKRLLDYNWIFERIIRPRPYAPNLRSLITPNR